MVISISKQHCLLKAEAWECSAALLLSQVGISLLWAGGGTITTEASGRESPSPPTRRPPRPCGEGLVSWEGWRMWSTTLRDTAKAGSCVHSRQRLSKAPLSLQPSVGAEPSHVFPGGPGVPGDLSSGGAGKLCLLHQGCRAAFR